MQLSIIIPMAPHEQAWKNLLPDLISLPAGSEIIFALPKDTPSLDITAPNSTLTIKQVNEGHSRATQMNAGARAATGTYLWFLHADSRLHGDTIPALLRTIEQHPYSLLYADLKFMTDATPLMKINEIGAWLRARFLGMPFGDQGLCIQRNLFQQIGGYPENVPYGEDHTFVWRARQHKIMLCPIKAPIFTSARKYREHGWFKTTLRHVTLTYKQAWPEFLALLSGKIRA